MSIPRNHHYVSQCHIKNFFNKEDGKIYLYDKEKANFYSKTTTKSVFSERDGNSRFVNGEVDHFSLEKDLRDSFEDEFVLSFTALEDFLNSQQVFTIEVVSHLNKLTKYGIAGEIRIPQHKRHTDDVIQSALFDHFLPNAAPSLKKELEDLKASLSNTKYSNTLSYSEFANKVFDLMGEVFFEIYHIVGNSCFILPDRPSFTQREKINEYYNPNVREIAIIDIPISSRILIHAESTKVRPGLNKVITLSDADMNFIDRVNFWMLNLSDKQVACASKEYLIKLLGKTKS